MAKTIKFNLICDGSPIRTLDDLRNHFSIEDMVEYYNNQLLQRWLKVRGYEEHLAKVEALEADSDMELVKGLIEIFDVENDTQVVEENTYILGYLKSKQERLERYRKDEKHEKDIITEYHSQYQQLVITIVENKTDMSRIKAAVKEIDTNYFPLFELNHRELLYHLIVEAPMAIFAMLMREDMRPFYLPEAGAPSVESVQMEEEDEEETNEDGLTLDKDEMYACICSLIPYAQEMLGENLIEFSGITDGYWKDLEAKKKQYMILKMENGNYIRSTGVSGGDLSAADINNKFVILDGIDYKSNNSSHKLLYLEV